MDLTGYFPKRSSSGNEYIMVDYYHDGNYTNAALIKNRRGNTIMESWQNMHNIFKKAGVVPMIFILDNETLKDLMDAFDNEKLQY